ncbi:hypothetical protein ACIGFL_06695 [Pseudomonas sp. NPDC077649]|uniref:hypothetical protein n=1 Tax=Pseudomonas sp. NPDC077649 TaxID=3364423 RepID=UPI0037C85029
MVERLAKSRFAGIRSRRVAFASERIDTVCTARRRVGVSLVVAVVDGAVWKRLILKAAAEIVVFWNKRIAASGFIQRVVEKEGASGIRGGLWRGRVSFSDPRGSERARRKHKQTKETE